MERALLKCSQFCLQNFVFNLNYHNKCETAVDLLASRLGLNRIYIYLRFHAMFGFQMSRNIVISCEHSLAVWAREEFPSRLRLVDLEVFLHVPLPSHSHRTPKTWTFHRSQVFPNVLTGHGQYHVFGLEVSG